ncbi:right-handed parallel beta-helix repeat-containing protein, partial [Nanoarchaeota archaeon]
MKRGYLILILITLFIGIYGCSGGITGKVIDGPVGELDLGDAPDSTNQYYYGGGPSPWMLAYTGVNGMFPTTHLTGPVPPYGPCHTNFFARLGTEISLENESDQIIPDQDAEANINVISSIPDRDSVLQPFGMDDGLKYVPLNTTNRQFPMEHCAPTTIPVEITVSGGPYTSDWTAYLNMWIDYNTDGDWGNLSVGDAVECHTAADTPEWVVKNMAVANLVDGGSGLGTFVVNVTFNGYVPDELEAWMRVQVTEVQVGSGYADGSGPLTCYEDGETEDYFIEFAEPLSCDCSSCGECEGLINDEICPTVTLTQDIGTEGSCIEWMPDDIVFDCDGYTITGSGFNGIELMGSNNTVQNCTITEFNSGIWIHNDGAHEGYNNILDNHLVNNTANGVYLDYSEGDMMQGNMITGGSRGVYMHYSQGINVDDNDIIDSIDIGVSLESCFLGGTKILMADGSEKNIEDVGKRELVMSYDEKTGDMVAGKVVNTFAHAKVDGYLVLNDGLKLTANHP